MDNVEPGNYKINFYYTYFNGEQWAGSTETVEFKVNNFVESHNIFLSLTGLFVAFISILPLFVTGLKKVVYKFKKLFTKCSAVPINQKDKVIKQEHLANKKHSQKNTIIKK